MIDDNASEEKRLQESFRQKTWVETVTKDSWMVFKVMSEFVDGYEKLAKIGPCVSIFGSARLKREDKYYEMAVEIAKKITEIGFGVITGGGPGIMEAGNKGAKEGGGKGKEDRFVEMELDGRRCLFQLFYCGADFRVFVETGNDWPLDFYG